MNLAPVLATSRTPTLTTGWVDSGVGLSPGVWLSPTKSLSKAKEIVPYMEYVKCIDPLAKRIQLHFAFTKWRDGWSPFVCSLAGPATLIACLKLCKVLMFWQKRLGHGARRKYASVRISANLLRLFHATKVKTTNCWITGVADMCEILRVFDEMWRPLPPRMEKSDWSLKFHPGLSLIGLRFGLFPMTSAEGSQVQMAHGRPLVGHLLWTRWLGKPFGHDNPSPKS